MGKHSTPCKYVHHWCHLCSSPGPAGFAMLVLPGVGAGHCWLPGGRAQQHPDPFPGLQQQGARPLRPPGAGWGAGLLAGHTAPCQAWQSPAPEGWPRGIGVMKKCPGVSEKGLERRKRCFLALELHSWPLPTAIPGSARERLPFCPVPSHPVDGGVRPCRRGREPHRPGLFSNGFHGQESHSLPVQGLHLGKVCSRGKGGGARACVWTRVVGYHYHQQHAWLHARTHSHTQTHACIRTDERNQRPRLYFVLFSGL